MPFDDPQAVAAFHWQQLAQLLPGKAIGLYLVGSVAQDDYWPGVSDVDSITVLGEPALAGDQSALQRVHSAVAAAYPGLHYDTTYVPLDWLENPPDPGSAPATPYSQDGRLYLGEPAGQVHPVTWLELRHGRQVAGAHLGGLTITVDQVAARSYVQGNLRGYWARNADEGDRAAAGQPADLVLADPTPVVWTVLGVPRLAAFLATGQTLSKTAAGRWLAVEHPAYAELALRAVAARRGEQVTFTMADVVAASALVRKLIRQYT